MNKPFFSSKPSGNALATNIIIAIFIALLITASNVTPIEIVSFKKFNATYIPTKVNIVGSVAGGTGSGTFLDMLVLVAKTLRESGLAYSISPWLVLPEVYHLW